MRQGVLQGFDSVRWLLSEAAIDANEVDNQEFAPLQYAIIVKAPLGVIRRLLQRGANVHHTDLYGSTALHLTAIVDWWYSNTTTQTKQCDVPSVAPRSQPDVPNDDYHDNLPSPLPYLPASCAPTL